MPKSSMSKADFITSLIFLLLGVYMIVEGLGMPGAGGFIEAGGEPGRVPVVLGGIVAFFAVILLVRSVSEQGHRLLDKIKEQETVSSSGVKRCLVTAAGCSFYAIGLLGADILGWKVMYYEATALFMFLFIVGFEWAEAEELGSKRWARTQSRWPSLAHLMQSLFGFISPDRAPYAWLIFTALLQTVLVTWGVTYVFEQEFYVSLP